MRKSIFQMLPPSAEEPPRVPMRREFEYRRLSLGVVVTSGSSGDRLHSIAGYQLGKGGGSWTELRSYPPVAVVATEAAKRGSVVDETAAKAWKSCPHPHFLYFCMIVQASCEVECGRVEVFINMCKYLTCTYRTSGPWRRIAKSRRHVERGSTPALIALDNMKLLETGIYRPNLLHLQCFDLDVDDNCGSLGHSTRLEFR